MTAAERKSFDELKEMIKTLEERIEERNRVRQEIRNAIARINEDTKVKWDKVEDLPDWARPTIEKLLNKGYFKGQEGGKLGLTMGLARLLVIFDRAGGFSK